MRQSIFFVAWFFIGIFWVQPAYSQWSPGKAYNINEETYKTRILWETDQAIYSSARINEYRGYHHIVASYNNNSYLVYIDNDWCPKIVKITNEGNSEEVFLDDEDYHILENDPHQFFAIGVDEKGYIHVFGDMHNFPRYNSGHLPDRYNNAKCMYWRSDNPEDISSFTWHGETFGDCPWGTSFTYPQIFYDQNGRLYFSTRVRSATERQYAAVNYNRYNAGTQQWELIGGINEYDNMCLFWEDNGEGGGTYSKPCRNLHFDLNNTAYFVSSLYNSDRDKPLPETNGKYNTDLIYAASDDFGDSFKRADGSTIEVIPMRIDEVDKKPDVILSNTIIGATQSQAITDYTGTPYALGNEYNENGDIKYFCYAFNSSNNTWEDVSGIRPQAKGYFATDRMGVITFFEKGSNKVHRFFDFGQARVLDYGFFDISIDRRHMLETGNIRGIPKRTNASQLFQLIDVEIDRPFPYPEMDDELSDNAYLNSLSTDTGIIYPVFDPYKFDYTVYVPSTINSINISSIPKHSGATISGNREYSNIPETATISVAAEDGITIRNYKIKIANGTIQPFTPTGDTYVRNGDHLATNFNDTIIRVKTTTNNPNFQRDGLMKFLLNDVNLSETNAVFLKLGVQWVKGESSVEFYNCSSDWDETTLTWETASLLTTDTSPFYTQTISPSDEESKILLDFTDYVKDQLLSGSDLSFRMISNVEDNNFKIWSKEANDQDNRPQLIVMTQINTSSENHVLKDELRLRIYPNPASNIITIETSQFISGTITMRNILGNVVAHQKISDKKTTLNIMGLKPGIYFLNVNTGKMTKIQKVIINS